MHASSNNTKDSIHNIVKIVVDINTLKDKVINDPEVQSLKAFIDGKMNPQALEAAAFTDRVIKKMGKDHISNMIYGSHSIGAGNALAAHVVSDLEGIPTKTSLLIEPVGASLNVRQIEAAMNDSSSSFSKELQKILGPEQGSPERIKAAVGTLERDIANDVVSLRAIGGDERGELRGSMVGKSVPGYGVLSGIEQGLSEYIKEKWQGKKEDYLSLDNPNNAMIGKAIFEKTVQGAIPTTSAIGAVDPLHVLADIVNTAGKPNIYFEAVDTPEWPMASNASLNASGKPTSGKGKTS